MLKFIRRHVSDDTFVLFFFVLLVVSCELFVVKYHGNDDAHHHQYNYNDNAQDQIFPESSQQEFVPLPPCCVRVLDSRKKN